MHYRLIMKNQLHYRMIVKNNPEYHSSASQACINAYFYWEGSSLPRSTCFNLLEDVEHPKKKESWNVSPDVYMSWTP